MDDLMYFNGVNGATGAYELPQMTPEQLTDIISGEGKIDEGLMNDLEDRLQSHWRVMEGVDPRDLAQSGWGVIFASSKDPDELKRSAAIKDALSPLLAHRQTQANKLHERYREYTAGGGGVRPGESKNSFLSRHGAVGMGVVDPDAVPYYLLIVGDPETIPYRFQYELDVQYAVGRIHFETVQEYAQYAQSVVDAETTGLALPRQATFFGVRSPDDQATTLSADHLIAPLAERMAQDQHGNGWSVRTMLEDETFKARLSQLVGGDETPALLFTASHGMGFPNGDPRQFPHQGALLCQDWPGPRQHTGKIPEDFYFSADDVDSNARMLGTMAFLFACYGAGTPKMDEFARQALKGRAAIAPHSFLARLPTRLLSHPQGGMLAVVGHVERAWGYSFKWGSGEAQLTTFESTLKQLMEGAPIGLAMEDFNSRYAEIATVLNGMIDDLEWPDTREKVNKRELVGMWTANNDARGYAIVGDPAVTLPLAPAGDKPIKERPTIKAVKVKPSTVSAGTETSYEPQAAAGEPSAAAVSFGWGDQLSGLRDSIRQFADELGNALAKAASDITSLQVRTYTTDNLEGVSPQGAEGAQLRALTRIAFDGDTDVFVPQQAGSIDTAVWKLHLDMVRQARLNRAESLQTLTEMAANLLKSFT